MGQAAPPAYLTNLMPGPTGHDVMALEQQRMYDLARRAAMSSPPTQEEESGEKEAAEESQEAAEQRRPQSLLQALMGLAQSKQPQPPNRLQTYLAALGRPVKEPDIDTGKF